MIWWTHRNRFGKRNELKSKEEVFNFPEAFLVIKGWNIVSFRVCLRSRFTSMWLPLSTLPFRDEWGGREGCGPEGTGTGVRDTTRDIRRRVGMPRYLTMTKRFQGGPRLSDGGRDSPSPGDWCRLYIRCNALHRSSLTLITGSQGSAWDGANVNGGHGHRTKRNSEDTWLCLYLVPPLY